MDRLELGYLPILGIDWARREYSISERATITLSDETVLRGVLVVGTRNQDVWHLVYAQDPSANGHVSEEKLRSVPLESVINYNPNIL